MKAIIMIALSLFIPLQAAPLADLKEVGRTELNWIFWKVYDIRLLSADGRYQPQQYPLAIAIKYARDISSQQLVESTVEEWSRQSIDWKPIWQTTLAKLWPDVTEGDEIILRVEPDLRSHFYFNNKMIGRIEDSQFAPAFLSIWLSENTRQPQLRNRLTGTL